MTEFGQETFLDHKMLSKMFLHNYTNDDQELEQNCLYSLRPDP